MNNIDCVYVRNRQKAENYSVFDDIGSATTSTIITMIDGMQYNSSESLSELEIAVCQAEVDSQKLDSTLNVYTAPFGKYNFFFVCGVTVNL